MRFLGHILDQDGIKIDPHKEEAVRETLVPMDRESLRRSLIMVNNLIRFSLLLSEVQISLRELDKDRTRWI